VRISYKPGEEAAAEDANPLPRWRTGLCHRGDCGRWRAEAQHHLEFRSQHTRGQQQPQRPSCSRVVL